MLGNQGLSCAFIYRVQLSFQLSCVLAAAPVCGLGTVFLLAPLVTTRRCISHSSAVASYCYYVQLSFLISCVLLTAPMCGLGTVFFVASFADE